MNHKCKLKPLTKEAEKAQNDLIKKLGYCPVCEQEKLHENIAYGNYFPKKDDKTKLQTHN